MSRFLAGGFALGCALFAVAADAHANGSRVQCDHCGPTGVTRLYRTIHPLMYVTRYHDRSVYQRVTRLHYVVDVTRIQPIIQVHDVTRVHHYTLVQDAYAYQPQTPAPVCYVQHNTLGDGCYCLGDE